MKHALLLLLLVLPAVGTTVAQEKRTPADLVNPLMGTDSKGELSNGNTYPAIALPWGMNAWMPQTGRIGNGWAYTYDSDKIRGFKQTHQPSPWINDYGQFAIMPVRGMKIDQERRASWFSHKTEIARPYYYSVYLADHDITAEFTPSERCALFRFTMPPGDSAVVVIDAFDRGSHVRVIPGERRVYGYTTRNSGGVPAGFKNFFVIEFDREPDFHALHDGSRLLPGDDLTVDHAHAVLGFKLPAGGVVQARVSSSFISPAQALLNLERETGG
jgi:predicted alpha-1,2-mannosidase